jgi:hypothetical protein
MSTNNSTQNKAAWLPTLKGEIEVGPAPMPTPIGTEVVI